MLSSFFREREACCTTYKLVEQALPAQAEALPAFTQVDHSQKGPLDSNLSEALVPTADGGGDSVASSAVSAAASEYAAAASAAPAAPAGASDE